MPELPEVTTIVRDLTRAVRGKVIKDVWTDTPKIVAPLSVATFRRHVRGKAFLRFERRGKFVLVALAPSRSRVASSPSPVSCYLVWHMRMTGHPLYRDEKQEKSSKERAAAFRDPRNQYVRLSFRFTDGTRLDYADVRKFGTLRVVYPGALAEDPSLRVLGPDALRYRWTAEELCARLKKRKTTLKQVLLDQRVLAGIGNIYADEILWDARQHPLRRTTALTTWDCANLVRSMRRVLTRAIRARGTSVDDFRDLRGRKGFYASVRRAYQRAGLPCFRCGARIAKIVVGGRGTHVCPRCQPSPGLRQGYVRQARFRPTGQPSTSRARRERTR